MYTARKTFTILITIQLILLMLGLSACSGGGGGDSGTTTVVTQETPFENMSDLEEYNGLLSALKSESINNPKEFATEVNSEDPLELFLKLKENNSSIQSEDMLKLMKTLEYEIALKPLLTSDKISSKALDSLKTIEYSIMELKAGPLRQWSGTSGTLDESSQESYDRQQWIAYNNELAAFGKPQLTLDEFKALKVAIKDTPAIFVNFGTAMQNVDMNSTNSSSNAPKRYLSPAFKAPTVGILGELNPVDETLGTQYLAPTRFLEFAPHNYMECQGLARSYPFQVMGLEYLGEFNGTPILQHIDTSIPLLGDEEGKHYFQINETGLAELLLFNKSSSVVNIALEHNGNTLFNISLDAGEKRKTYIPVMDADVCVPYYLTKDDTKIEATLLQLQKPANMDTSFDSASGSYDLTHTYDVTAQGDTFVHAGLVEFMLRDVVDGSKRIIRYDTILTSGQQTIQYIVQAPSGKLYTQLSVGDGYVEVDAENGKWLVYTLPMVPKSGSFDEYTIDSTTNTLTSFHVIPEYSNGYGAVESFLSIAAGKVGNLKQFVVAEMKNAEFSHDGESAGSAAEVTLSLHSNMAPKLEFGKDLDNAFTNNELYNAYTCWFTHGRDVNQFSSNQACSEMYEGMKLIYERYMFINFGLDPDLSNTFPSLTSQNDTFKQNMFVWYGKEINKQLDDERFKLMFETYASIYDEWKNSVVQINDMHYPSAYHYGIKDSVIRVNDGSDPTETGSYITDAFYHPNIPVNMPILAVTKERMASTSVPFAFEYSAHDADEVDSGAQLFAIAKYVVNQALAVATGNYAALVCNTVDTMQEMRQNEINGEDDPIGEADFFLNRFSTEDSFYGISAQKDLEFSISGLATVPNHYTSYDKNLEYAALACNVSGAVVGGYNLYNSIGTLISGDFYSGLGLAELRLDALDGVDESSELYTALNEAFDAIENGTAGTDIFEILKASSQLEAFANGIDIFNSLSEASSDLGGLGGAGHNVMRSEANYFFSSFEERKTRSNIIVKEVGGRPVTNVKVVLDSIKIQNNYEDGDAEVKLRTRVGVVSDQTPSYQGDFASNAPFMVDSELVYENGSNGYETLPNLPFKGYLLKSKNFNGVADGDNLDINAMQIYNADYPTNNNAAAIFVEVGLFEGDGGGVDDDMIGVYSKTFYLEDIYNIVDGQRWTHPSGRVQRLEVSVPVYSADNLATSVELLDADNRTKQLAHNRERINNPSAIIHFTIEVTLGNYVDYAEVDVSTENVDGDPNHGKGPMDMSLINLEEVSYLNSNKMQLQQVYNDQAVVVDYDHGIRVARIDEQHQLSWRTAINSTNLPNGYNNLLDDVGTNFFKYEPIYRTSFIDDNHLLVFRRALKDIQPQLVVMDIPENNASVATIKGKLLPTGAVNMATVRVNANHLKVFVTVPNLADNSGVVMIYDVGPDEITEVGSYDLLNTPTDILAIDDKTLLVKSKKFKHRYFDTPGIEHDEYWTKELYLELLELESNQLLPKDLRQYTFKHDSFAEWTGQRYPTLARDASTSSMRNINEGVNNRIVYTAATDYESGVSALYTNLIYNSDTGSYRFGSTRKTKIKTSVENPGYAYYLDNRLAAYPSDLSRDGRVATTSSELFPSGKQVLGGLVSAKFLDARYILGLMNVSSIEDGRPSGDELVLIDTLHIENTPPVIIGDDFDQEHILEHVNSYHKVINFSVSDVEKNVSDLNISFKILDPDTNETIYEGTNAEGNVLADPEKFWFASRLECDSNGECFINITYLYKACMSLKHDYELNIQDGDITVTKHFKVWQAPSLPNIESVAVTSYRYDDRFSDISANFASSTAGKNGSNGCVKNFTFDNLPSWLGSFVDYDLVGERKILRLEGTPPLGTPPGLYDTTVHAVNERGEDVEHFLVTVMPPDLTPDLFVLHDHYDENRSTIISETILVSGIQADTNISISGGEYSFDKINWSSASGSVGNGVDVYIRHTTSSEYSSDVVTVVNIGGVSATMRSRTIPDPAIEDTTPDSYVFLDNLNAPLASEMIAEIDVTGINRSTQLSIVGGEYSLDNAKTWSNIPSNIEAKQHILVRHTSAATYQTTVETIIDIGGVIGTFTTTTKADNDPDIFSFVTQEKVEPNEMHTASAVITGLGDGVNAVVTLTSFARGQGFSVNGQEQTTISNGDTLTLYHVSSSEWETPMVQTVQIGDVSVSFTTVTKTEFAQVPDIVGAPQTQVNVNGFYDYTPQLATGSPAVDSWSIVNKPDWADFNTTTGRLSGTPTLTGSYSGITINAINEDGSDSISFDILVESHPPYIDGGMHSLDEEEMYFSFTDNASWRSAITSVTLDGTPLVLGSDYILSEGEITLYITGSNNVKTTTGMWSIVISANGYNDAYINPYIAEGKLDLEEARETLVISNLPMAPGRHVNLRLHTVDRFGNEIPWASVEFATTIVDNNNTFIEPYKVKNENIVNADYYNLLENNQTLQSDDSAWLEATIEFPACIDVGDGFDLALKRSDGEIIDTYNYVNASSECVDIDWTLRYTFNGLNDPILQNDTAGNLYIAGRTASDIDTQVNNGVEDIYVAKYDRNGVKRWETLVGGGASDQAKGLLIGKDGNLYIGVMTYGNIEQGSVDNAGLADWGLVKIDASNGSVIFKKQGGTVASDETKGITQNGNYINLITDIYNSETSNYETYMQRYTHEGNYVDSIRLSQIYGAKDVDSNSDGDTIITTSSALAFFDENGSNLKYVYPTSRPSRLVNIDLNDSLFVTATLMDYGPYPDNFYGELIPNDKHVATIEKRSANGHYLWSRVLSSGDTWTDTLSARMNDAVYVAHSDKHNILQGANTIQVTSLFLDTLNQFDGNISAAKVWSPKGVNEAISLLGMSASESTHGVFILSTVTTNAIVEGTNRYGGNMLLMKKTAYDLYSDTRSGMERIDSYSFVNDYDNNLQWIDSSYNINSGDWEYVAEECNMLTIDVSNSWRFPTVAELLTTIDSANDPALKSTFTIRYDDLAYFTSEELDANNIMGVYYWSGGGHDAFSKSEDRLYYRCVRNLE